MQDWFNQWPSTYLLWALSSQVLNVLFLFIRWNQNTSVMARRSFANCTLFFFLTAVPDFVVFDISCLSLWNIAVWRHRKMTQSPGFNDFFYSCSRLNGHDIIWLSSGRSLNTHTHTHKENAISQTSIASLCKCWKKWCVSEIFPL